MALLQRKLYFFKDPEGVQNFPGGVGGWGGVQMLISIETCITCDFPGGGGSRPPLDLHMHANLYHFWIPTHLYEDNGDTDQPCTSVQCLHHDPDWSDCRS